MIPYAARTGTLRNLAALRAAGWRLLVSAKGRLRHEGFQYALDNGAWSAHVTGTEFDGDAFQRAVDELGAGADWIVLPDIVAGGLRSLELSLSWLERIRSVGPPVLLPVQNGMEEADVREYVGSRVGIFLGGSTEWKLKTMARWGTFASFEGCHYHAGRVNSAKRIALCMASGVHSFDGSGPSRFAQVLPRLDNAVAQRDLFGRRA